MSKRRINGPFAARTIEMLRSPAMRVLSLTGHRILARLEIELAMHGGKDNGRLPVTHADFQQFGIDRKRDRRRHPRGVCLGVRQAHPARPRWRRRAPLPEPV